MHKNILKTILSITILFGVLAFPITAVHAQNINCQDLNNVDDNVPQITQIICPIARGINVLILFAGVVFTVMIMSSVYKYATSLGDPKGAMGATATLTNAVLGFVAVIGFFAIFSIITSIFGLRVNLSPAQLTNSVQCGVYRIFTCTTQDHRPIVQGLTPPDNCNCN